MSWTQQELIEFCNRKNIPLDAYSFYKDQDDSFCLEKIGGEWLIYYSERGSKNELAWAKSEAQALNILKLFLLEAFKSI
ncbi:hypothetical protein HA052_26455 [Chromobacterium haemolyticum]|uniref:Uncharacterized protein n=1 Tax=Chromobacterium fluminis TaxID=3044269 RepID=A0ABX0LAV6_9NEIS|nr:hypothetical protein [Chromobacterium haemolyticum]NHR08734.1 hypothetical protein [Chromobacterium haemolyticum]